MRSGRLFGYDIGEGQLMVVMQTTMVVTDSGGDGDSVTQPHVRFLLIFTLYAH